MATIQIPIEIALDGTYQTLIDRASIDIQPLLETDLPSIVEINENRELLETMHAYLQPLTVQPDEIKKRSMQPLNTSFKKYHHMKKKHTGSMKHRYTARTYS